MGMNCKVTELFCVIDAFCIFFDSENAGMTRYGERVGSYEEND